MRRLYPAIIIILSVCLFYYIFDTTLHKHINNLISTIEKTDEVIIKNDFEKAQDYCKELEKNWKKTKKLAGILIDEKAIENAGYYVRQSQNTVTNKNKNDYLIFSDSLKYYIKNLAVCIIKAYNINRKEISFLSFISL